MVDTVFFGGGTPSLMPPETVAAVIEAIARGLDAGAGRGGHARGQPDLGRGRAVPRLPRRRGEPAVDGGAGARTTPTCARSGGCTRSPRRCGRSSWRGRSFAAGELRPDLCAAGPGAGGLAGGARPGAGDGGRPPVALPADDRAGHPVRRAAARGRLRGLPDAALAADMYLATQEICDAAGLAGYEISNHARPGAESRHNLVYWRYGDYAGIGPGAHGRLTSGGGALGDRGAARAGGLAGGGRARRHRRRARRASVPGPSRRPRC